jgi:hypothetical protein
MPVFKNIGKNYNQKNLTNEEEQFSQSPVASRKLTFDH